MVRFGVPKKKITCPFASLSPIKILFKVRRWRAGTLMLQLDQRLARHAVGVLDTITQCCNCEYFILVEDCNCQTRRYLSQVSSNTSSLRNPIRPTDRWMDGSRTYRDIYPTSSEISGSDRTTVSSPSSFQYVLHLPGEAVNRRSRPVTTATATDRVQ